MIALKKGQVVISGKTEAVIHSQSIEQVFDVKSQFIFCGEGKRDYIVL